jgi:hypothetical protein
MKYLSVFPFCAALLCPAMSQAEQVLETGECFSRAYSSFTFSVADVDTQKRLDMLYMSDIADDGKANLDSRMYLAQLQHLPKIAPDALEARTYVVYRWFPYDYIHGAEAAPEIRVFLSQEPLKNADGIETNESPNGAVVFLPMHGKATDAATAAAQFVTHICRLRAQLFGQVENT